MIDPKSSSSPNVGSKRLCVWSAFDFAEGGQIKTVFTLRFVDLEVTKRLHGKVHEMPEREGGRACRQRTNLTRTAPWRELQKLSETSAPETKTGTRWKSQKKKNPKRQSEHSLRRLVLQIGTIRRMYKINPKIDVYNAFYNKHKNFLSLDKSHKACSPVIWAFGRRDAFRSLRLSRQSTPKNLCSLVLLHTCGAMKPMYWTHTRSWLISSWGGQVLWDSRLGIAVNGFFVSMNIHLSSCLLQTCFHLRLCLHLWFPDVCSLRI